MKKVSGYISVRALGCYDYEFYVDDDATEEEIKQKVAEYAQISQGYNVEEGYEAYTETRYRKRQKAHLGRIMNKYIKTNLGKIPLEDYLDIVAESSGFDDYSDMQNAGYKIDINKEDIIYENEEIESGTNDLQRLDML